MFEIHCMIGPYFKFYIGKSHINIKVYYIMKVTIGLYIIVSLEGKYHTIMKSLHCCILPSVHFLKLLMISFVSNKAIFKFTVY